jgi:amino acid adenylation domain-containing protein
VKQNIVSLFEAEARRRPAATALRAADSAWTYGELNARANGLARRLRESGVVKGDCVAACMERSFEAIAGVLAILKTGAAYVPADPQFPVERIRYMIEDTGAKLTLVSRATDERVTGPRHVVDAGGLEESGSDLGEEIDATTTAVVMYTSGTSGKPKGAEGPHGGICRLVKDAGYVHLDETDVVLHHSTCSFDAATFEIWAALLNGGALALYPNIPVDFDTMGRLIREYGVTTLLLTTSVFHLAAEHKPECLATLKKLVTGGDVLQAKAVKRVIERYPHLHIVNGYGPTENSVFTTCFVITGDSSIGETVPIGQPICGTNVVLLDEELQPVETGQVGELFTNGIGMARGYKNHPELTAERFLRRNGETFYRTGDLARRGEDGNYYFVGRADGQVKIRGFRVEPGEIEAVLNALPDVAECVVTAEEQHTGEKQLAAYVRPRLDTVELKQYLAGKLPSYMVPAFIYSMAEFPMTMNGKIDRRRLREAAGEPLGHESAAGKNGSGWLGATLETWRRHLSRPSLGETESIYDYGASSLTVIVVQSELNGKFGRAADPMELVRAQTPREWADIYEKENS